MNKIALIGLLTASMALTAAPALAKDGHHDSYGSQHKYERHGGNYGKHHNKQYGKHYNRHHDKSYRYGHRDKYYKHGRHYNRHHYNHGYGHSRHVEKYYYRDNDYVEDYFKILGGTILINELLYHGHQNGH